jgi:hypothetical protein
MAGGSFTFGGHQNGGVASGIGGVTVHSRASSFALKKNLRRQRRQATVQLTGLCPGCSDSFYSAIDCTPFRQNHSDFQRFRVFEPTLNLRVVGSIPTRLTI